ncbi:MAG: hypothetical protein GPJ54_05160 [Candidatus Heimdallarchaeota archaeon]|nr:hypothetical protein [Candidatus Heimdallarchaeota archaeon]
MLTSSPCQDGTNMNVKTIKEEEINLKDSFKTDSNIAINNDNKTMYYAMAASFVSVILYLLILAGAPYLGDRASFEPPLMVPILASAGYLAGGVLIYFKERRLLQLGLIINAFVIILYFVGNGSDLEFYGIIIKVAQVALEILLLKLYQSIDA